MFTALYILLQISNFAPKTTPTWTVMFYLAGDNDLQQYTKGYCDSIINNMNLAGKPCRVNVAIQIDASDTTIPVKRYFFFGDSMIQEDYASECDMADEQELIKFSQAAITRMGTTSKYAVILYGHGCNWKGIIQDQHPFDWMGIPNGRFQKAISGMKQVIGQNIDVLGLFACQMQTWEVQQELSGLVDLTVGCWTSALTPRKLNYMRGLLYNSAWPAESLAIAIAKTYAVPEWSFSASFSVIRTPMISNLTQDIDQLGLILKSTPDSVKQRIIDDEIIASNSKIGAERVDLGAFVAKLKNDSLLDNSIKTTAMDIEKDIEEISIFNPDSLSLRLIISIYFPQILRDYDSAYDKLTSSSITNWDEYLRTNNFSYFWCYGWTPDYLSWKPSISDTTRKKSWSFSDSVKQVKIHFSYLNLADGDTLLIYDSNDTCRYTGKRGDFFTSTLGTIINAEFRGHYPISPDCFCIDNIAWTEDEKVIGIAEEKEKVQKTTDFSVWPNPFQKELHIANVNSESEAIIYDISGRVVKKISLRKSLIWDGKDALGKTVNQGIYFLKIGKKSLKFVKIY